MHKFLTSFFSYFNPQISQITWITLIIMKDDAKSIGFNSPQLAAIEKITHSFDTPWLATG